MLLQVKPNIANCPGNGRQRFRASASILSRPGRAGKFPATGQSFRRGLLLHDWPRQRFLAWCLPASPSPPARPARALTDTDAMDNHDLLLVGGRAKVPSPGDRSWNTVRLHAPAATADCSQQAGARGTRAALLVVQWASESQQQAA